MREKLFLITIGFLASIVAGVMNSGPQRPKQKDQFIFPTVELKRFTFGYDDSFSDTYWIRLIQDYNVCVNPKAPPDAPRTGVNRTPHCELDWGYHMLELITDLTPRHYVIYSSGGTMLSVVVDDIKGASRIYQKGLGQFPKDWRLNFQAGTHYMSEVGDLQLAAYLFNRAVENGSPGWVASLSAKLFDEMGRTELAITNLRAQLKRAPDEKYAEAVQRKLTELEDKYAAETVKARQERNAAASGGKKPPKK